MYLFTVWKKQKPVAEQKTKSQEKILHDAASIRPDSTEPSQACLCLRVWALYHRQGFRKCSSTAERGQRMFLEDLLELWELRSEPTSLHLKDQVMNASVSWMILPILCYRFLLVGQQEKSLTTSDAYFQVVFMITVLP